MSIEFKNPTEAITAVATVIIAADKMGSFSERDTLLKEIKKLDEFTGFDTSKVMQLVAAMNEKVYASLPSEDGVVTVQGFRSLLGAAKKVLSPDMQRKTFLFALALAGADNVSNEETALLDELQKAFNLDTGWKKAA